MAKTVLLGLQKQHYGWTLESWDSNTMSVEEYVEWLSLRRPDVLLIASVGEEHSIPGERARQAAREYLRTAKGTQWVNMRGMDIFTAYYEGNFEELDALQREQLWSASVGHGRRISDTEYRAPLPYFTEHKSFADSQFSGFEVERSTSNAQGMAEPQQWFDKNDADFELWRKGN